MNTTKMLISGIAGGIAAFFAGWLIYGILLMDFMTQNSGTATGVMRADSEMVWWALIAGNLLSGILPHTPHEPPRTIAGLLPPLIL